MTGSLQLVLLQGQYLLEIFIKQYLTLSFFVVSLGNLIQKGKMNDNIK